jgi:hypothetical protein
MTERQRLEELMRKLDAATAEAFLAYVASVRNPAFVREIERLIRVNQIEAAVRLIDTHLMRFASVIPRNYTRVGESTVTSLEPAIRRLRPRIAISFDPANQRASAQMQRQTLELVTRIGDDQRTSIRNALTEAFNDGAGPRQAARAFRDSVGLTETQRQAVNNYREMLERGSVAALDAGLADRRYSPLGTSLADRKAYVEALTPDDIDRMTDAYRRKYVKYRSEVIARTETTRTLSESNDEAFRQTMEQAEIGDDFIERTWQFTHDGRTRSSHRNMQVPVVRGLNTQFVTGLGNRARYPGDPNLPADDVIQCRCVATNRILRADEVTSA